MKRNYLLDNAKYLMIFFVVFGHLIEPLIHGNNVLKVIYLSIYSFHMPAFIIVSGMLSKAIFNNEEISKLIKNIIIPLVAFTLLNEVLTFIRTGDFSEYTKHLRPYQMLWFLYSLFIWKLMLPVFLKFKFPIIIAISIGVAIGCIESVGYLLGLSRTLYFFPFFLIGYKLTPHFFEVFKSKFNSKFYVFILLMVIVLNIGFFTHFYDMQYRWLYGSYSYSKLGVNDGLGSVTRMLLYVVSFFTVMSVLLLIPAKKTIMSSRGVNSLYVYIWHGFMISILTASGFIAYIGESHVSIVLITLIIISLTLTFILSEGSLAKMTRRFMFKPVEMAILNNK